MRNSSSQRSFSTYLRKIAKLIPMYQGRYLRYLVLSLVHTLEGNLDWTSPAKCRSNLMGKVRKRLILTLVWLQMWMWMAVGSVALLAMTVSSAGFEGLQGKFCASRSNACCDGRIDQCSVRVYGKFRSCE